MKCCLEGCAGDYKKIEILHTVRYQGQVVVIDNIPAEVCTICGDVLLEPETVQYIEELLGTSSQPAKMVPLYEYT